MSTTNITNNIKGYKINFVNNTLIMNYKFSKQAMVYGSPEYIIRKAILEDFPCLTTVVQSGRVKKTARPTKRLTYANMRTYIGTQKNSNDLLEAFEIAILRSKKAKSPYKYVRDWFNEKFPHHEDVIESAFDEEMTEDRAVENTKPLLKASGF